jgi:hypothetical protein
MQLVVQLLGFIGSGMILLSFIFVTRRVWKPQSRKYLLVNLLGAILLAIYQLALGAYAGVLLNLVFVTVAASGLVTYWASAHTNSKKLHKRK